MKNRIFAFLSFVTWILPTFAQEYRYAAVYDAAGPVKEINTKTKLPLVKKKVKINKKGMGGLSIMLYDEAGLPVGWEMNNMGRQNFQKFFWNNDNLLDSVSVKVDVIGNYELIAAKNTYSDDLLHSQVIEISSKESNTKLIRLFSEYIFDNYGNWISRKVRQTEIDKSCTRHELDYTETREIKYYSS